MFTGIVERVARIERVAKTPTGHRLVVEGEHTAPLEAAASGARDGFQAGESIALNGVCLTLLRNDELAFDVIPETLRRTNLGELGPGSWVNLERALRVGDRLGGHYVQGHVDTTGVITEVRREAGETVVRVEVAEPDRFRCVPKGSATVDGVSLTVVDRGPNWFTIALIPHTLSITTFGQRVLGDRVNLEMDHFGKWVEELQRGRSIQPAP
ncbi:MAG: riboflavin synthase [Planctomycetota bacterium]